MLYDFGFVVDLFDNLSRWLNGVGFSFKDKIVNIQLLIQASLTQFMVFIDQLSKSFDAIDFQEGDDPVINYKFLNLYQMTQNEIKLKLVVFPYLNILMLNCQSVRFLAKMNHTTVKKGYVVFIESK